MFNEYYKEVFAKANRRDMRDFFGLGLSEDEARELNDLMTGSQLIPREMGHFRGTPRHVLARLCRKGLECKGRDAPGPTIKDNRLCSICDLKERSMRGQGASTKDKEDAIESLHRDLILYGKESGVITRQNLPYYISSTCGHAINGTTREEKEILCDCLVWNEVCKSLGQEYYLVACDKIVDFPIDIMQEFIRKGVDPFPPNILPSVVELGYTRMENLTFLSGSNRSLLEWVRRDVISLSKHIDSTHLDKVALKGLDRAIEWARKLLYILVIDPNALSAECFPWSDLSWWLDWAPNTVLIINVNVSHWGWCMRDRNTKYTKDPTNQKWPFHLISELLSKYPRAWMVREHLGGKQKFLFLAGLKEFSEDKGLFTSFARIDERGEGRDIVDRADKWLLSQRTRKD